MELSNRIRYCFYIAGVFSQQQSDPLCGKCRAFANSVRNCREGLLESEKMLRNGSGNVRPEIAELMAKARVTLDKLVVPEDAPGQKKAGNCKMPEGVCFVKTSKKIIDQIAAITP